MAELQLFHTLHLKFSTWSRRAQNGSSGTCLAIWAGYRISHLASADILIQARRRYSLNLWHKDPSTADRSSYENEWLCGEVILERAKEVIYRTLSESSGPPCCLLKGL